jgi:predicted nucleic acid-binding protein
MAVRVVDASALGALVFGEPRAEEVATALSDGRLVAPALLWFELASIALKKIKAHANKAEQILAAFHLGSQLAVEVVVLDHVAVVEFARQTGLTTYDASYVWLALHVDGELVTLDRRLRQAAKR